MTGRLGFMMASAGKRRIFAIGKKKEGRRRRREN
ncbi:hypothetical protein CCACVL1_07995 [Corchorus capsularis]|uniref:Uncharacterized protein n=1 Tax=Corchorus capsularis TaxID=210143 RepID=A0A1R3J2T3_COCAP|nr:hypothetical protein CCACVL1_07995 [Corchorus capsularis]